MSEENQLPSDSDQDDEDYVPDGIEQEVSEAESEGYVESDSEQEDENDENKRKSKDKKMNKKGKRSKRGNKKTSKKAKIDSETRDSEHEDEEDEEEAKEKKVLSEAEEKKRADSLWADFMKDTGTTYKAKLQNSSVQQEKSSLNRPKTKKETVKVTKVFEFAGEEVKIEKQVPADSAEARLVPKSTEKFLDAPAKETESAKETTQQPVKRGGLGGISSVLGQIGKKSKISTLEKSKLDWDNFKKVENINEEINTYNRGKDGYLERQDFLQRADLRQFEIEKNLRTISRRNNR